MDRCLAGGPVDVFFGGVRTSVLDVVKDGVVEEDGVLRNDPDGLPQAFERDVLDITAVNFDLQTKRGCSKSRCPDDGMQTPCRRGMVTSLTSWPSTLNCKRDRVFC
jgi:hypothetical protein